MLVVVNYEEIYKNSQELKTKNSAYLIMKYKIVIIDNYDSFTYNLSHLLKELGADVTVLRNDQFQLSDLEPFDKIVLSPGPGIPSEAGLLLDVIRTYAGRKPLLGVCLGHQAIGEVFGAKLENLSDVFHGVATVGTVLKSDPLFDGCPERLTMGRYHSWVVSRDGFPDCLEVLAESDDGEGDKNSGPSAELSQRGEGQVMALRHRDYDIYGIQFHPESVLTPDGRAILSNWLSMACHQTPRVPDSSVL